MAILNFVFAGAIIELLNKWNVITGLVLAAAALVLIILSRTIIKKIFKNKTEEKQTVYAMRFKIAAAAFAVAGLMIAVLIQ